VADDGERRRIERRGEGRGRDEAERERL